MVNAQALGNLIIQTVNQNMQAIDNRGPLAQKDPSYYEQLCNAIAIGLTQGTTGTTFTTDDSGFVGEPAIPATGMGVGIIVDSGYFTQQLYTQFRNAIISKYGKTTHDPYMPGPQNSGRYLAALMGGISQAVTNMWSTGWQLTSVNPMVYSGTGQILDGDFTVIMAPSAIANLILDNAPKLSKSYFWPQMAQIIAQVYVDTIQNHSTGQVQIIGVCVPGISQVCGVPGTGQGTGIVS